MNDLETLQQENNTAKVRHISHLEDDVMKYRNFLKELHKSIHQFERVTEKPIIKKHIERGSND